MPRRYLLIVIGLLLTAAAGGGLLIDAAQVDALLGAPDQVRAEPIRLEEGKGLYTLLLEAHSASDLHGVLRVALEGTPGMNYSLFNLTGIFHPGRDTGPELDKGLFALPEKAGHLHLGIVLQPKPPAPAEAGQGTQLPPCCRSAGQLADSSLGSVADLGRPLQLNFYDSASGRLLLRIPIQIGTEPAATEDLNELFQRESAPPSNPSALHG